MDNQNQDENTNASSGIFSGGDVPKPAQDTAPDAPQVNERELLMNKARLMGIEFSNNIGTDTLRARINAKLDGVSAPASEDEPAPVETNALTGEASNAPKKTLRQEIYDEQMKLVRIRITCMDPKKKDLQGEIFTIANEYLGTVRKFVPFGDATENGFHVPYCIYTMLKEREFLNIRTLKDRKTGSPRVESNYAKEFAIEVLPPLTQEELKRLATAQIAAGSLDAA